MNSHAYCGQLLLPRGDGLEVSFLTLVREVAGSIPCRVILPKKLVFSKIIIPTSSPCPLKQGAYLVASFIGLIVYSGKVMAPAIWLPSILNPPIIFSATIQ